jgi:hypothetical protein
VPDSIDMLPSCDSLADVDSSCSIDSCLTGGVLGVLKREAAGWRSSVACGAGSAILADAGRAETLLLINDDLPVSRTSDRVDRLSAY